MQIDSEGKIKIPKEALELMEIDEKSELRLSVERDRKVIKRAIRGCIFCSSTINLIGISKYFVCERCRDKLSKVKAGNCIY